MADRPRNRVRLRSLIASFVLSDSTLLRFDLAVNLPKSRSACRILAKVVLMILGLA